MKQKNQRKSRAERAQGLTLVEGNWRHVVIFPGIEPTLQERSIPLAIFVVSQRCMSFHILGEQKLSFNQINWYLADKYSFFFVIFKSQDVSGYFGLVPCIGSIQTTEHQHVGYAVVIHAYQWI